MKIRLIVLIIILTILLVGCEADGEIERVADMGLLGKVKVVHDSVNNVTCWVNKSGYAGGIDCIPDWQLMPPTQ